MVRKIFIILVVFISLVLILFSTSGFEKSIVVTQHNYTKEPIKIEKSKYKDRYCNMTIEDISNSSQAVLPNGDTLFFDDIGCLVLWLSEQKKIFQKKEFNKIILWVWAKDTSRYINAREAWYSLTDSTPMRYGFSGYEKKDKNYINFDTMQDKMLKGETLRNRKTRKELFGNN